MATTTTTTINTTDCVDDGGGGERKQKAEICHFPKYIIDAAKKIGCRLRYDTMATMGDVSVYSCLMPWQAASVDNALDKIKSRFVPDHIIDATAHNGCDALHLANYFPLAKISAIEYDEKTSRCLQLNVDKYLLSASTTTSSAIVSKIDVYHGDAVVLVPQLLSASVPGSKKMVFKDPPWGGRDYKKKNKEMTLFLGKRRVVDLCYEWLTGKTSTIASASASASTADMVLLKVPVNFDFSDLRQNRKLHTIIYPITEITDESLSGRIGKGGKLNYFLLEITVNSSSSSI